MNAGLLFYCARRTSACEAEIARAAGWFGLSLAGVRVCTREDLLNRCMAALLKDADVVFAAGGPDGGRPACAAPIFRTLRVPLGADGEPKGVKRLPGRETAGYLLESASQAIVVLPDDPWEFPLMLPAAMERLRDKFGLSGEIPAEKKPDYERMVLQSMGPPDGKE
jgi:hypothetical protein